jgi:hypothetical protein
MLCRWDVKAYDIGFLLAILDYVLDLMGFDSRFEKCRFGRPARLYVKALVLKEVCKASLRYAESLSKTYLAVRIPKSTLHYWEVKHGDVVGGGVEGAPKASDPNGLRLLSSRLNEVYGLAEESP